VIHPIMFVKPRSHVAGIKRPMSEIGRETVIVFADDIFARTFLRRMEVMGISESLVKRRDIYIYLTELVTRFFDRVRIS